MGEEGEEVDEGKKGKHTHNTKKDGEIKKKKDFLLER